MSHPQVPYDPLLDASQNQSNPNFHGTPQITAHDIDDPVQYQPPPRSTSSHHSNPGLHAQPSNPNLYGGPVAPPSGNMAGVGLRDGGGMNMGSDFGPPAPHFLGSTTRGSTYSSSSIGGGDRQSGYGSITGLRDSSYQDKPLPQAGYAYPPGASPPTGAYRDDPSGRHRDISEKQELYEAPRAKTKRKGLIWAAICCGLVIVIAAVVVPVYFFVIKKSGGGSGGSSGGNNSGNSQGGGSTSTTGSNTPQVVTTGGDGSIVTKSDGTTFTYKNTLGGYWVYDVNAPLNNSARAQSYTPPLSEPWKFGVDRIYGYVQVSRLGSRLTPSQCQPWRMAQFGTFHLPCPLRTILPRCRRRMDTLHAHQGP